MNPRTSRVWKFIVALLPAAGIVVAQTRMDDDWTYSRTINSGGLVHYFNFEGSGANLIGSATATSTNGVVYAEGLYGFQAAQCQSNRWFTLNSDIVLSNEFTTASWVRANRGPGNALLELGMIFGGLSSTQGYVRIQTNYVYMYNDGETKGFFITNAIPSNVWTHVATTCTATQQCIYVNGMLVGRANLGMPFVIRVNSIGTAYRIASDGGERFTLRGLLEELRFYNRAYSSGEVFNIYSEATP